MPARSAATIAACDSPPRRSCQAHACRGTSRRPPAPAHAPFACELVIVASFPLGRGPRRVGRERSRTPNRPGSHRDLPARRPTEPGGAACIILALMGTSDAPPSKPEMPAPGTPSGPAAPAGGRATDPFIFVLGHERSGTTMLRAMLDSHPDLAVPPEAHSVVGLLGHQLRPLDLDELLATFARDKYFADWQLEPKDLEFLRRPASSPGPTRRRTVRGLRACSWQTARGRQDPQSPGRDGATRGAVPQREVPPHRARRTRRGGLDGHDELRGVRLRIRGPHVASPNRARPSTRPIARVRSISRDSLRRPRCRSRRHPPDGLHVHRSALRRRDAPLPRARRSAPSRLA